MKRLMFDTTLLRNWLVMKTDSELSYWKRYNLFLIVFKQFSKKLQFRTWY